MKEEISKARENLLLTDDDEEATLSHWVGICHTVGCTHLKARYADKLCKAQLIDFDIHSVLFGMFYLTMFQTFRTSKLLFLLAIAIIFGLYIFFKGV